MIKPPTREEFVRILWRLRIWHYAQEASAGKWIAYQWLQYALSVIQTEIMRGGARVVVNAPPRHGKSEAFAHWLPTWFLDTWPDKKVILGSHGDDFASEWGLKVRSEFEQNPMTRSRVSKQTHRSDNWQTTEGGGMRSMGVGGSVVGRGGDLIVITDPHKSWTEVQSPTYRKRVRDWFDSDVYTRLEPGASIVVEHTRWHEDDLTGYLLADHGDEWTHVLLPALAEPGDALGRVEGEALCPERFSEESLTNIKKTPSMGSYMFAGLYQQRPSPVEGGLIKREWFRRFSSWTEVDGFEDMFQSWDLTFKAMGSSFVVCEIWARKGGHLYLVDLFRGKLSFPDTIKQIGIMSRKWPKANDKLIEDAANGAAVIATLQDQVPGIIARRPAGSKETRLAAVSGLIESGNVWIPAAAIAPWAEPFIEEVITFPNASHDDQVDAMSQALSRFGEKTNFETNFLVPDVGGRVSPWREFNATF